jgi:RNA polymerase sigma-70 factor (ECF subfamily)
MNTEGDLAAVEEVLAGRVDAFEGIVRRWQKPVLNLAWRWLGSREAAEDLAQDIFLAVYRALPGWKKSCEFSTWLFAVALNHARSKLRRAEPDLLGLEVAFELPDRSQDLPEDPRAPALRRAIVGLPAVYREAILQHYFEGRDVRAASAVLGIREGTLKARLSRARSLLGRTLEARP